MNWYYVENGQQAGPVDETALADLVQSGKIQPSTLVWHEGMPDWKPYAEATGAGAETGAPPAEPPLAGGQGGVICVECGKAFPPSEVIRYQDKWICALCKPTFFQRLREGGGISGGVGGQVTETELLARDYDMDIGDYLSRAWEIFKSNAGLLIGATVLVYVVMIAINIIPYLNFLLVLLVGGPLMGGLWVCYIKTIRNENATIGDAFSGFSSRWGQLVLVQLIPGIISFGFMALFGFVAAATLPAFAAANRSGSSHHALAGPLIVIFVALLCAFFVVMLYLTTCWMFALPLVADKKLSFWPALQLSRRMVQKHWWMTFLLIMVSGLLAGIGVIACGVGVLITAPLGFLILGLHYDKVFGALIANSD